MDESNIELDSFTAEMIRRVNEHKKNLDKLMNSDDDDDDDDSNIFGEYSQIEKQKSNDDNDDEPEEMETKNVGDSNANKRNPVNREDREDEENNFDEPPQQQQQCEVDDLDDLDDELLNDNYQSHIRKSISALLNVRKSILAAEEEEEEKNRPAAEKEAKLDDDNEAMSEQNNDDDEVEEEEDKTTRLNRRLDRLSKLYSESESSPQSSSSSTSTNKVLTENKVNIRKRSTINSGKNIIEIEYKPKKLKDRLNDIARFYYPIDNASSSSIIKVDSTQQQSQTVETTAIEKAKPESTPPAEIEQNVPKFSSILKRIKEQESIGNTNSATTTTSSSSKNQSTNYKSNKIQESSSSSVAPINQKSSIASSNHSSIQTVTSNGKKVSVSDLKQIFENKAKTQSGELGKPEIAPELLSLKDKKRLFEKAIREEEDAASRNQYRKPAPAPPPAKRIVNWAPSVPRDPDDDEDEGEGPIKRAKNSAQNEQSFATRKIDNQSQLMSMCSVISSSIIENSPMDLDPNLDQDGVQEQSSKQQSIVIDDHSDLLAEQNSQEEEEEQNSDEIENRNSAHQAVEQAFKTIDNFSLTTASTSATVVDEVDCDNITFSSIDCGDQLQRSSTKVDLQSTDSMNTNITGGEPSSEASSFVTDLIAQPLPHPPPKPARMYLYESDEPEPDTPENLSQLDKDSKPQSPPPLRTISFYRREQKEKFLQRESGAAQSNECQNNEAAIPVINLRQKLLPTGSADIRGDSLREFARHIEKRIAALKEEVSEHNRISGQASTALSMCLSHGADLALSDGRIEAERLLLISAEKRNACLREINRLKNPAKHGAQTPCLGDASKGAVHISNLRVPLRSEFVDSRAKGKVSCPIYFICLVFSGPKVFVSELVNACENVGQDFLEFNFGLTCQELAENFAVRVQLFAFELRRSASAAAADRRRKKKENAIARSIRMKFGKSAGNCTTEAAAAAAAAGKLAAAITTPPIGGFKPIGHVTLNLATVRRPLNFYRLESSKSTSSSDGNDNIHATIDGYLTMSLRLDVTHRFTAAGYFDLQDRVTSFWNLRYFAIRADRLLYWRFEDDYARRERRTEPLGVIELKHCVNPSVGFLRGDQKHVCMRPYTFALVIVTPPAVSNAHKLLNGGMIRKPVPEIYFISAQAKEEGQIFAEQIGQALRNIRTWQTDATQPYSLEEFNRLIISAN